MGEGYGQIELPLTSRESSANEQPVHTLVLDMDSSIVRVVILAAGQGKRLLPLTAEVPKALLDIGGKTLIERQIEAFASAGIRDFTVVIGYGSVRMEDALAKIGGRLNVSIATVFNPFYAVADNLASCWMARQFLCGDVIQVNGDNVFRGDLVEKLLAAPAAPLSVAINFKQSYDSDDMKVILDRGRLTEIGKTLPVDTVDAEAVGFYVFRENGAKAYVEVLERAMRDPQALKQWFPSAIGSLAKKIEVRTVPIDGLKWCEVDFPVDLQQARQLVASW
jgi:L-glutamine-phosphate cytidylyltransferase